MAEDFADSQHDVRINASIPQFYVWKVAMNSRTSINLPSIKAPPPNPMLICFLPMI